MEEEHCGSRAPRAGVAARVLAAGVLLPPGSPAPLLLTLAALRDLPGGSIAPAGPALLALGFALGFLLARSRAKDAERAVRELVGVTRRIASGAPRVRASAGLPGEAGELAKALNRMADEIERSRRDLESRAAQLKDAYIRLLEIDRLKSDFLSNVSHELRTPMTSVHAATEVLLTHEHISRENTVRFLRIIHEESERLTRLIDDLLDLSRIEAGRLEWSVVPFGVGGALEHVVSGLAPLAARKGIGVVVDAEPELPEVLADRDRVIQVVTNLLGNALKFTPEGGRVRIAVRRSESGPTGRAPGGFVEVEVADSGRGIDPVDQVVIFDRFRQAGDVLRGKPRGTGLGLPISREIVEHLGGRMWLRSSPGEGSAFAFTLPIAGVRAEEEAVSEVSGVGRADYVAAFAGGSAAAIGASAARVEGSSASAGIRLAA